MQLSTINLEYKVKTTLKFLMNSLSYFKTVLKYLMKKIYQQEYDIISKCPCGSSDYKIGS